MYYLSTKYFWRKNAYKMQKKKFQEAPKSFLHSFHEIVVNNHANSWLEGRREKEG